MKPFSCLKTNELFFFGVLYYCSVKRTSLHIYMSSRPLHLLWQTLAEKKQLYPIVARHISDAMQATILQKLKTTCHDVFGGDTARRNSNILGIFVGQHSKVCVNKYKMFQKKTSYIYKINIYIYIHLYVFLFSHVYKVSICTCICVCGFDLKQHSLLEYPNCAAKRHGIAAPRIEMMQVLGL